ncbi:hypothetical protein JTB14_018783 [Gonioctena quinquepunctata]|nr:hypothetical protein JTB14_018783 [Gonioctena quinquepunctata]
MSLLEGFTSQLQEYLIGNRETDHNIIRRHTKKLDQLGDVSFPLNIQNWYHLLDKNLIDKKCTTIFDYNNLENDLHAQIARLRIESDNWQVNIAKIILSKANSDVYIFVARTPVIFKTILKQVIESGRKYGSTDVLKNKVQLNAVPENDYSLEADLSLLRIHLLKDVTSNLLEITTHKVTGNESTVTIALNPADDGHINIMCGPVLGGNGTKTSTKAEELYKKRTSDMRMMAQHKYGVQIKPSATWETYFEKLGRGSVTIEMLSNKPQKPIKITQNDLQSANKGAAFIFYNCARLAALFKEFDKLVSAKKYPDLPEIDIVDFSLLSQQEEWDLFYVYILQYPIVIKNCIKDIEKGLLNPQYLISLLSNLTSVFSVYYRRVRILTSPREHMFAVIHARIYLLKAVQCVFHNALGLVNIEPIKEM